MTQQEGTAGGGEGEQNSEAELAISSYLEKYLPIKTLYDMALFCESKGVVGNKPRQIW